MEWASNHLPKRWLYSSMDDDFMLNVIKARDAIDDSSKQSIDGQWGEFPILCMFRRGEGEEPVREANGLYKKWYINESRFQWHVFPVYCHGWLVSFSLLNRKVTLTRKLKRSQYGLHCVRGDCNESIFVIRL